MDLWWLGTTPRTPWEVLFCRVVEAAERLGAQVWPYGGYAMEAHAGRSLREHQDIDLIARRSEWSPIAEAVTEWGYVVEYAETGTAAHLRCDGAVLADVLLVEEHPEGFPFVRAPLGANPLPPGSLTDGPVVRLWGHLVQVVSLECLYVMKASGNFTAEAGQSLRAKDQDDLAFIRSRLPPAAIGRLARYCRIVPAP